MISHPFPPEKGIEIDQKTNIDLENPLLEDSFLGNPMTDHSYASLL